MISRLLEPQIEESLRAFPVVAILGARQVGKTTLARRLAEGSWNARYVTLDDRAILDAALRDPDGFVDELSTPVVLDEVQRAPDLLRSVKRVVDRNRKPGSFLLTGSANFMTLRSVSESLAGRVAIHELLPFSLGEIHGKASPGYLLEELFTSQSARDFLGKLPSLKSSLGRADLASRILAGGYPVPAQMSAGSIRSRWFESYRTTYLERDLRDVSRIVNLSDFSRLLTAAALRTGQLLNVADLSRDLGIPVQTVRRHLSLLETTYQITVVLPWFTNIGKRLVKTPKLFFDDTGMAANLAALDDWESIERQGRAGALVETFVAAELRKLATVSHHRTEIHFWRTHAGREVDLLLARGDRLAGVEVKWAARVTEGDLGDIRACRDALGTSLGLCAILYSGSEAIALGNKEVLVPIGLFLGGV